AVERGTAALSGRHGSFSLEDARPMRRSQVDDAIADCDAASPGLAAASAAKDRKGQVLDRKIGAGGVGRGKPAAQAGVVSLVDHVLASMQGQRKITVLVPFSRIRCSACHFSARASTTFSTS